MAIRRLTVEVQLAKADISSEPGLRRLVQGAAGTGSRPSWPAPAQLMRRVCPAFACNPGVPCRGWFLDLSAVGSYDHDVAHSFKLVMKRLFVCLVLLSVAAPTVHVAAQSLADVARKEEARRKTTKPARKVYGNGDLRSDSPSTPPPASAGASTPPPSAQVPSTTVPGGKPEADAKEKEPAKDQAYWSERIRTARSALDRSKIFADALQSRINALNTDFVNRDDPAQRAQIELERQRAVAELDRVKRETAEQTKAIANIEEEARKAGVPPGWLR